METLVEAMNRLRDAGYTAEYRAMPGGLLRCDACGTNHDPSSLTVDETVRFEGESNPDDESILVALSCDCGARGLYTSAFGPDTAPDDAIVLQALADR